MVGCLVLQAMELQKYTLKKLLKIVIIYVV